MMFMFILPTLVALISLFAFMLPADLEIHVHRKKTQLGCSAANSVEPIECNPMKVMSKLSTQ